MNVKEMMGVKDLMLENPGLNFSYDYDEDLGGVLIGIRRGQVRCERLLDEAQIQQIVPDLTEFQVVEAYKGLIYDMMTSGM